MQANELSCGWLTNFWGDFSNATFEYLVVTRHTFHPHQTPLNLLKILIPHASIVCLIYMIIFLQKSSSQVYTVGRLVGVCTKLVVAFNTFSNFWGSVFVGEWGGRVCVRVWNASGHFIVLLTTLHLWTIFNIHHNVHQCQWQRATPMLSPTWASTFPRTSLLHMYTYTRTPTNQPTNQPTALRCMMPRH